MQFTLHPEGAAPDLAALSDAFADADPAALVDFDAAKQVFRISTSLRDADIIATCASVGWTVAPHQVVQVPSECCGGCGG